MNNIFILFAFAVITKVIGITLPAAIIVYDALILVFSLFCIFNCVCIL